MRKKNRDINKKFETKPSGYHFPGIPQSRPFFNLLEFQNELKKSKKKSIDVNDSQVLCNDILKAMCQDKMSAHAAIKMLMAIKLKCEIDEHHLALGNFKEAKELIINLEVLVQGRDNRILELEKIIQILNIENLSLKKKIEKYESIKVERN